MNAKGNSKQSVITSYTKAPTRTVTAGDVTFAYRELGPKGGIPVVLFVHLAATLDYWDPRIVDPIAKNRHVIAFDQRGVGATTGEVPDSIETMADDAFIRSSRRSASTRSTSSPSPWAASSPRRWWPSTRTWSANWS